MTSDPDSPAAGAAIRAAVTALPLALLGLFLAAISWRRWPDLLIDFGQQLYIPWRLSEGERLGRDLLYFHGPLSQHLHALLFRLCGVSFSTLIAANLLVVALLTWILARIARRAADRLTAFAAAAAFLSLFAFAQYVMVGNYNFLAPYTHEATHGVVCTAGMLLLLGRHLRRGDARSAVAAGLLFGLALLTKVEAAVAAAAVVAAAFLLAATRRSPAARGGFGVFLAAAALPPLLFFLWFLTYLPLAEAVRATAAGFLALGGGVTRFAFHRHVLGLDDLPGNLFALLRAATTFAFALLMLAVVDRLVAPVARRPVVAAAIAGLACFGALAILGDGLWVELPRALPFLALAVIVLEALRRAGASRRERHRREMLLLLAVWGLASSLKGILNLHLFHYGFTLALPAAILAVVVFVFEGARLFASRQGSGTVFRGAALGMVAAALLFHLRWTAAIDALRTYDVGRGGDRMRTFAPSEAPAGPLVGQALDWLERESSATSTLVTLPEGIMINYLARRVSTVPFTNFVTAEVVLYGQDRMVEALEEHPPDFVAFVSRSTEELGTGRFGAVPGYGRRVVDWVEQRYEPAAAFGDDPFAQGTFGIRILKRRGGAPAGGGESR